VTNSQPWYLAARAENMAIVLLTERSDLEVIRQSNQSLSLSPIRYIDLLVRILQPAVERSSMFGVEVKAIRELPRNVADRLEEELNQPIRIHFPIRREDYEDYGFPICCFLFEIQHNIGFYRWIISPKDLNSPEPTNKVAESSDFFYRLTPQTLNDIVNSVVERPISAV